MKKYQKKIEKTIDRILRPRHYWRDISFDELGQLYASMMFRYLGLSLVGIFVPIYLLELGYSLTIILAFYGIFYISQGFGNVLGSILVGRHGPKRTMAVSYVLQVVALLLIASLDSNSYQVWLAACIWGAANGVFYIAYHVNFSKIRHAKHGGKEIGYMNIVMKVGALIGPLVGGLIATIFSPEYTFLAAILFFVGGLVPLTASGETTRSNQPVRIKAYQVKPIFRDLLAYSGLSVSHSAVATVWPVYIAVTVFTSGVYVKLGGLSTISAVAIIAMSYIIGKLIDNNRGRLLLRVSTCISVALHITRIFVQSVGGVVAVSIAQEFGETATRMPLTKGMYDSASRYEGHRIVYILIMEAYASVWKSLVMWLAVLVSICIPSLVFTVVFVVAAIGSTIVLLEKFPALDSKKV